MIERISQTFMKTMKSYLAGEECGNVIRHIFIDRKPYNRTSKWMAVGNYFEWLLTGTVPKSMVIPKPVYMKTSLDRKPPEKLTVDDMTEDYRRAHANAIQVKSYLINDWGLEIVAAGKHIVKGNREGTIDLVCKATKEMLFKNGTRWKVGDFIVLDVKYSGLMEDKWSKLGWTWAPIQKAYNRIQAVQYYFLTEVPFYFLVVQSNNKAVDGVFDLANVKLFHIPVTDLMLDNHIRDGNFLLEQLALQDVTGLKATPSLLKCSQCPIKSTCADRMLYPEIERIEI